ncbi:MAG: ECF transporter S component [Treponema sp.]|nr:ECF transporter S component [Treponema sp.]
MRNIKIISVFAAIGFALSLIFGLISRAKFYVILLRALIFAIIFALIGFLISFLVNKYLVSDDGDVDISTASDSEGGEVYSKGHKVDFVVQDDELDHSESENHFVVGENRQMLNNGDYNSTSAANLHNTLEKDRKQVEKTKISEAEDKSSFVPLRSAETVDNFSGNESKSSAESPSTPASQSSSSPGNLIKDKKLSNDDEIDVLPDMSSMDFSSAAKNSSENQSDGQDTSDVSSFGDSSSIASSRSNSSAEIEIKDASLMAKAISSVLSDENS